MEWRFSWCRVQRSMGSVPSVRQAQTSEFFAKARRLTFAAVAFFLTAFAASTSYAQSSAFAGMAGTWSGAAP